MVSLSCSTTITVFPFSCKAFSVFISLFVSRSCKPIEGSSSTYNTPVKPEPI